ncbi:DUF4145 domain-containing protein [Bosea sp. TWI1241]|uniref:DUF4145 domain-containing protein n=1 Tax=Bosea sp. TWI1241 TaxID=3148904 RepID=UPI003209C51B
MEATLAPEKAHCPTCNRQQNCDVHGRIYKPWSWSDRQGNGIDGGITHTLFECRGCNTVFYETSSWDDNDFDFWYDQDGETQSEPNLTKETYPKPPSRPRPDWFDNIGTIDPALYRILDETYKADEMDCHLLTAVGLRTALDSCVTAVKIDPAISFSEKLKALLKGGYIGETEHDILTVLTDAGNAAAHQGWAPAREEVRHLLDVLETFIKRVLVNGKRALAMKEGIPQKQRREKPAKSTGAPLIADSENGA